MKLYIYNLTYVALLKFNKGEIDMNDKRRAMVDSPVACLIQALPYAIITFIYNHNSWLTLYKISQLGFLLPASSLIFSIGTLASALFHL